jgi:hypothetical protein
MLGPSFNQNYPGRTVKAGDIIFLVNNYVSISTWQDEYDGDGVLPRNWLMSDKYEYVLFDESAFEISTDTTEKEEIIYNAKQVIPWKPIDFSPYAANFKIIKDIPWKEVGGGPWAIEMPIPGDTISGLRMRVFNDAGEKKEILLWHAVLYGVDTRYYPMIPIEYLEPTKNFASQGREAIEDDYSSIGISINMKVEAMPEDTVKIISKGETTVRQGDTIIEKISDEPLKTAEIKNTATAVQTGVTDVVSQKPLIVSNFTEDKTDIPFIIKVIGIGIIIWLILK